MCTSSVGLVFVVFVSSEDIKSLGDSVISLSSLQCISLAMKGVVLLFAVPFSHDDSPRFSFFDFLLNVGQDSVPVRPVVLMMCFDLKLNETTQLWTCKVMWISFDHATPRM